MPPAPPPAAAEPVDLAALLHVAEQEVGRRRARDMAAHLVSAARVADVLAAFALLLPWLQHGRDVVTGVQFSTALTSAALAGIALRQVVLAAALAQPDRNARAAVVGVQLLTLIGATAGWLTQAGRAGDLRSADGNLWAPAAFAAALLTGSVLAIRAAERIHDALAGVDLVAGVARSTPGALAARFELARTEARRAPAPRPVPVVPAVATLTLAGAGLLSPWQRLGGPAVSAVAGRTDFVWLGIERPETLGVRWAVAITTVVVLMCAVLARTRRALPAVMVLGGTVIAALALVAARAGSVTGLNAELAPSTGVAITVTGGVLLAIGGLCALPRGRRRPPLRLGVAGVVAALVALGALTLPLPPAGASTNGGPLAAPPAPVFGAARAASRSGLGVDLMHAGFDADEGRPAMTASPDGQVWFLATLDRHHVVIDQAVRGRVLPVTLLDTDASDPVQLIAVQGHYALVKTTGSASTDGGGEYTLVRRVDLRRPRTRLSVTGAPGEPSPVLLRVVSGFDEATAQVLGPGEVRGGDVTVEAAADGSFVAIVSNSVAATRTSYVIEPAAAWRGTRWPLTTSAPAAGTTHAYGPAGTQYAVTSLGPRAAVTVAKPAGASSPVLGGIGNAACRPSRDPLATYAGNALDPRVRTLAVDRGGDVWMALLPAARARSVELVVRTPDGRLRRPRLPRPVGIGALRATPDGALWLSADTPYRPGVPTEAFGSTYRLGDAAGAARRAALLPVPSAACAAEAHLVPHPTGRGPHALPGTLARLPIGYRGTATVLDRAGTVLLTVVDRTGTTLLRERPGGAVQTLATVTGERAGLAADGRGGAWWYPKGLSITTAAAAGIWHVAADGRARLVAHPAMQGGRPLDLVATVDAADGTLFWSDLTGANWRRTTLAGRTTRWPAPAGRSLVVGHGRGYTVDPTGLVRPVTPSGLGPARLGPGRPDPASVRLVATLRESPSRVDTGAGPSFETPLVTFAVTRSGRLLVDDGDLARLDGGRLTLLATRAAAAPLAGFPVSVIGDSALFIGTTGRVFEVRVS